MEHHLEHYIIIANTEASGSREAKVAGQIIGKIAAGQRKDRIDAKFKEPDMPPMLHYEKEKRKFELFNFTSKLMRCLMP